MEELRPWISNKGQVCRQLSVRREDVTSFATQSAMHLNPDASELEFDAFARQRHPCVGCRLDGAEFDTYLPSETNVGEPTHGV